MPDEGKRSVWSESLVWFLIALACCLSVRPDREFVHLEARYACFVQEWLAGVRGWFPTLYGTPYLDYPATGTAVAAAAARLCGGLTRFSLMLPTALCAAVTVGLTFALGARLHRHAGRLAAVLLLVTPGFLLRARSPNPDMAVAAVTVAAALVVTAALTGAGRGHLASLGPLFAAGFLVRGSMGAVVPGAVAAAAAWLAGGRVPGLVAAALGVAVAGAGQLGLEWAAAAAAGPVRGAVSDTQVWSRVLGSANRPLHYYFTNGLAEYAPAFPLALAALWLNRRTLLPPVAPTVPSSRAGLLRSLAAWLLLVPAGLTLATTRHTRYLLPMAPAAALLAAWVLADGDRHDQGRLRRGFERLCRALPWLLAGGAAAGALLVRVLPSAVSARNVPLLPAAILAALTAVGMELLLRRRTEARTWIVAGGAVLAFQIAVRFAIEPLDASLEGSRPFVHEVSNRATATQPVFYRIGPDGTDVCFMVHGEAGLRPIFVRSPEGLARLPAPFLLILRPREVAGLPTALRARFIPLAAGRLGGKDVLAWQAVADPRPVPP